MQRREVLKNLGLATGFFVATPTIISLLQSCTSEAKTWIPEFLSIDEGVVLTNLADIFIPKTDIPSATEINVPQFIDKYIKEVLDDESQAQVKTALGTIISILKPDAETKIEQVTQDGYKALLDNYMLLEDEIDQEREADLEAKVMTKSEFLNNLKWMTINAYKTSEEIGENVLAYDPVPGAYICGDLQELTGGKSWSL